MLGYHRLTDEDRHFFVAFFSVMPSLAITSAIINQAIALRQQHKISLGDAIIAATALVHALPIATHNVADFQSQFSCDSLSQRDGRSFAIEHTGVADSDKYSCKIN